MATTKDYIEYVCEMLRGNCGISYRKMFGEYMVYANGKPILLVCDNTVFVKKLDVIKDLMYSAEVGIPYGGAKERYILDVENSELCEKVVSILEEVTPLPVKKHRKKNK